MDKKTCHTLESSNATKTRVKYGKYKTNYKKESRKRKLKKIKKSVAPIQRING